jgi:hypothetical protein
MTHYANIFARIHQAKCKVFNLQKNCNMKLLGMTFHTRPPMIARAPRPWLSRDDGECAFPIDGEGMALRACCNPCGEATYCPPHTAAMRGPRATPTADLEREIVAFLERVR